MTANEQAFPKSGFRSLDTGSPPEDGLTKREYFAAFIAQGLLAATNGKYDANTIAKAAFQIADAMIAEMALT